MSRGGLPDAARVRSRRAAVLAEAGTSRAVIDTRKHRGLDSLPAGSAPPAAARELDDVYGTGADRLRPFADTLVVRELAHALHDGVPGQWLASWDELPR